MRLATFTVAARYCGPPGCGNGGYVAGLLAGFASEPVIVHLRQPTPVDVTLEVHAGADASLKLMHGEALIAEALPEAIALEVPPAVEFREAEALSKGFAGYRAHAYPNCFGCGVTRADGEGLRLYPGPDASGTRVVAPWRPHAAFAGTRARVRPEFHWTALDCPGYFALMTERVVLTASLAARVDRPVAVGEPCVAIGWKVATEGRRHRVGTAIYGADGECVARALATWVEPRVAPEPSRAT